MAFVVILHLAADRKSMLADILGRWTSMRVIGGEDGTRLERNCVYVPPPHALVSLAAGTLCIRTAAEDDDRMPRRIDAFS
jgi:two-component system CheB/CheR fusion protein